MSQQQTFACPGCGAVLVLGVAACGRCHIRLTGPDAVRLWQVDQQLGALSAERRDLVAALTPGVEDTAAYAAAHPTSTSVPSGPVSPVWPTAATAGPRKSVSGQQLLLGIGALMLLSAVSFFLVVVWIIVGVAGQAFIMLGLTGAAVGGSVLATRRGLPAGAETAAVLATGFLFLDLSAAHALGLAGLDRLDFTTYWSVAAVVGGALLLFFDRLVPRVGEGVALRRIATYRPGAAVLFAAAPWFWFSAGAPEGAWLCATTLAVAVVNLGSAAVALRLDTIRGGPRRLGLPAAAVVLFVSAGLASCAYAAIGLYTAYDSSLPRGERYAALALLSLTPLTLAVLSTRAGARLTGLVGLQQSTLPALAVGSAALVLGVPLADAAPPALVAVSVLVAVVATCFHLGLVVRDSAVGRAWLGALSGAAFAAQPVLFVVVSVLLLTDRESVNALLTLESLSTSVRSTSSLWAVAPAAVWAASSLIGTVRRRSTTWALVTHVAIAATLVAALWGSSPQTWASVLLVAFACTVALACVAVRRGSYALVAPRGAGVEGDVFWAGLDRVSILVGAGYAIAATTSAVDLSAGRLSFTLVSIGVLVLVYAAAPARLPFAYLGSLVITAGTANLMRESGVETTEAYTAPLVLLLAAIGLVQWSSDRSLPTTLTMGPALSVALGPSLLTSLDDGDELRLAVVTAAAIGALVLGLQRHWKAPVTVGGLVLVVVAVTQGGPLVAYVPGWMTLGAGGAALLTAGVAWESAVVAGRRATTWYDTLR